MKIRKKKKLQRRLLIGLGILTVVLILALGQFISRSYRSSMEEYYSKIAFDQAKIASRIIDGDSIAGYVKTGQIDEYYETIRQYLLDVKQTVGLKYFYVVIPLKDEMIYIWDAGEEGEEGVCWLGDFDDYYGNGEEVMKTVFSDPKAEDTILITNNNVYGYLASAYVPILDSTGEAAALASVDISMDKIDKGIQHFLTIIIAVIITILTIFMPAYFFYIRKIILEPLNKLNHAASGIVSEQIENMEGFTIDIHTGDEMEGLADAFTYMVSELNQYIKNLTAITAEKERISVELNMAAQIQADMLPGIFPAFPERDEFEIFAAMTPAKEVGGDFYDFFLVDDDHLAMVMADVSGKGVPAALFMMISKTLIKTSIMAGLDPSEALFSVNNQLCENNQADMFVTVWLGVLTLSTGRLLCANGGHEYPVLKRKKDNFELIKDKHGFVLGGIAHTFYTEYEMELREGDRLYLYTDGVPEATDSHNQMYGLERMVDALNSKRDSSSEELLKWIKQDIDEFTGKAPQFDDITMLTISMLVIG